MNIDITNRLILGTVQFGLDYGISNKSGQVSYFEAKKILDLAASRGIKTLDTASGYGESEEVIGRCGLDSWNCISKLSTSSSSISRKDILDSIHSSLLKLGKKKLDGLLVHNSKLLLGSARNTVIEALSYCQQKGVIDRIGVSIYDPSELDQIFDLFKPDIIQVPYNAFDQRIERSGWLNKLKENGVEVHARSIFLQGLLLMDPSNRPKYFSKWDPIFDRWEKYVENSGFTNITCALRHALDNPKIDRVLIGVQSEKELNDILVSLDLDIDITWNYDSDLSLSLIDPRRWDI